MKNLNEWKFLILTAVSVSLLGLLGLRDLMTNDDAAFETFAQATAAPRAPASLSPMNVSVKSVSLSETLLEWNFGCRQSANTDAAIRGDQLRMKGRSCGKSFQSSKITIVNETNGFTASVFAKGQSEYETDFIRLREGANKIRVQYLNPTGQRTETVLTVTSAI